MIDLLDTYMAKHILISALLIGLYHVLYRKHRSDLLFNRGYLLFALALSIVLPHVQIEAFPNYITLQALAEPIASIGTPIPVEPVTAGPTVYHLYIAIALVFLVVTLLRIGKTALELRRLHELSLQGRYTGPACSFFWYMAIPDYEDHVVVSHEAYHVSALHSLDRIAFSLAHALLWANPVLFLYKKYLIENHEYAADLHSIAANGLAPKAYVTHLLQTAASKPSSTVQPYATLSHQYESLILNRIKMLRNNSSLSITSKIALIPIALLLFSAFTFKSYDVITVQNSAVQSTVTDTIPAVLTRTDTVVVMNYDTKKEQTMIVTAASPSLEKYLQSLTYSGKMVSASDTITMVDFDTMVEKTTIVTYTYPVEIEKLIWSSYGDRELIIRTAKQIMEEKD